MLVAVAGVALIVMMVLISLSALGRYTISMPINGSEVIVGMFLAPLVTYLAAASALAHRQHVGVTAVVVKMGARLRAFSQILFALIAAGMFGLIAVQGGKRTLQAYSDHQMETNISVPIFWAYMVVPIGAGALVLSLLALAAKWAVEGGAKASLARDENSSISESGA